MERLISYFKQLSLQQFIPAIILSAALLFVTACSPSNAQGARPYNPPVQMGGNNNPHSMGGDGYMNSKMTTDPKITNQRSALDLQRSIASSAVEPNPAKNPLSWLAGIRRREVECPSLLDPWRTEGTV
jgi:hypothetical protein